MSEDETTDAYIGSMLMMTNEMEKMNKNLLTIGRLSALAMLLASVIIRSGMSRKK